jgi:AraC-like DNA-binding protein
MNSVLADAQPLHYATAELPMRDRVPFWRDVFAKKVVQVDIEPEVDIPFEASAAMRLLPGIGILSPCHSTPAHLRRTAGLVADGDDSVAILVNLGGRIVGYQREREAALAAGDAMVFLHAEPAGMRCSRTSYMSVLVPHKVAAGSMRDVEAAAMLRIPADNEALRLLVSYVQLLPKELRGATSELGHSIATHIQDLFVLALGATRDAAKLAHGRGLRAARLQAIKADILNNLDSSISVTVVAKRACVTPRYVQLLFESEGTTFSEYVLERRLARVHRILVDQRFAHRIIADIVYDCGFGDLSYFNRTFRRRYGATPSDIRAKAH